ncbi:MAG: hypothetical protein ACYDD2_06980 [Candidatus Acidiferrales bacterium]
MTKSATKFALTKPKAHRVNRSQLRQEQRAMLRLATGNSVVVITGEDEEDDKLVLDKRYFDELVQKVSSLMETLEITTDRKLFGQVMKAAETLDEDVRRGKLHSFREAFGGR